MNDLVSNLKVQKMISKILRMLIPVKRPSVPPVNRRLSYFIETIWKEDVHCSEENIFFAALLSGVLYGS